MEEKYTDDNYKKKIEGDSSQEEPSFSFFITSLGLQASIALGNIPNPITNCKDENIKQARLLIDTLAILKEKTKGNLSLEEENLLNNLLYELRIQYINKTKKI
ncbi:MAG: DUF1844 domain-containing protein [Candidatus Omnitrophica bacterium]|nr:DUF1844 domain-containing protein [Candidatus Omnitrophota bacterium]